MTDKEWAGQIEKLKKRVAELELDMMKVEVRIASNTNRIKELEQIIDKLIDE